MVRQFIYGKSYPPQTSINISIFCRTEDPENSPCASDDDITVQIEQTEDYRPINHSNGHPIFIDPNLDGHTYRGVIVDGITISVGEAVELNADERGKWSRDESRWIW